MRGLELHYHAKPIQRSKGKSAVAAAAYRAGEKLIDERTGLEHDYSRKQGVEHSQIYTPENAPEWAQDRGQLWNEVEQKENRKNSNLAYDFTLAFPHEMDAETRQEMGETLALEMVDRYNAIVDISYHQPDKGSDERNFHAHILMTTRGIDETSPDGWEKNKIRDLAHDTKDENKNPYLDEEGNKTTRGALEIKSLRDFVASKMNEISERDQLGVKVEHESFEKRGVDREAQIHVGLHSHEIEAKGEHAERFQLNEEIKERNRLSEYADKARTALMSGFSKAVNWVRSEYSHLSQWEKDDREATLHKEQGNYITPLQEEKEQEKQQGFSR